MKNKSKKEINTYNAIIGNKFKEFRLAKPYTQEQVSLLSKLTPEYISKFEKGFYNASVFNIIKLCKSLSITPNQLLSDFFAPEVLFLTKEVSIELNKLNIENQRIVLSIVKQLNDYNEYSKNNLIT